MALPLRSAPSGPEFRGVNQNDTLLWDTTLGGWVVGPGGGGGAVSSVFGRTGAVVAVTGDYDSDQVDNVSTVPGSSVSDALENLAALLAMPLGNVINVNPLSTVTPQTGTLVAPFTTIAAGVAAVPNDEYWIVRLAPGTDTSENLTIPGTRNIELQNLGWDGTAGFTGDISWDPDGGTLALSGIWMTGNITGESTDNGGFLIMNQSSVLGDVLMTYGGAPGGFEVRAYLSGDNTIDHLSGEDLNMITGDYSMPGKTYATFFQFRGDIDSAFLHGFGAWFGGLNPTTITIREGGASFIDSVFHAVTALTCVEGDDPVPVVFDQFSANSFNVLRAQITDGVVGLSDSDVDFGQLLPDANASIDPDTGSLFWVQNTTGVRDYDIAAPANVGPPAMVAVECRDTVNSPNLNNDGGTPGLLAVMANGFGYVAVWDGTDWNLTMVYRLGA